MGTEANSNASSSWLSPRHWLPLHSWWWGTREIDCTVKINRSLPCWLSWKDDTPKLELFTQFERNNPFARPYLTIVLVDLKNITVCLYSLSYVYEGPKSLQMPGKRSAEHFLHLQVGSGARIYPEKENPWFKPCTSYISST